MQQKHTVVDYFQSMNWHLSDIYHIEGEKFFKRQSQPNEIILLSRMLTKINKRNTEQIRMLAISNDFVYNIEKKQIKRKIPIHKIYGATASKKSFQFILHIPSENDLLYKSQEHRDTVLLFIAIALKLNNCNGLSIYFVEDEDIGQYCQHEVDSHKQSTLHPKCELNHLYPESFQLNYINLMNKSKTDKMTVLFVDDPYKLRIKLEDYHKSVILARGSISKIYLLHNKSNNTQSFSVLKSIPEHSVDVDLLEFFLKTYQKQPFIEELELCLTYNGQIHFIFKFVKGGDLYQHLKEIHNFTEQQAKYIIAQIAMGLSDLHEKGIIFGDLKPENVLMDERGYVCLTDFGYGKLRMYQEYKKTKAINFTIEYASPEYINHGDLTRMSDWYSLGILLYELLVGIPPFYHTDFEISLKLISKGELHFPRNFHCSSHCKDLITKLVQHDSAHRIGFQSDFKDIQQHPWFIDINWEHLSQKKLDQLSYTPQLNDIAQISERYFTMDQLTEDERNW